VPRGSLRYSVSSFLCEYVSFTKSIVRKIARNNRTKRTVIVLTLSFQTGRLCEGRVSRSPRLAVHASFSAISRRKASSVSREPLRYRVRLCLHLTSVKFAVTIRTQCVALCYFQSKVLHRPTVIDCCRYFQFFFAWVSVVEV